ncbi:hypothetical protein PCANB_002163 [Pneumocystis canis]|nr:hypothetical protein PCANB_002163 [Pneumocystis canis]
MKARVMKEKMLENNLKGRNPCSCKDDCICFFKDIEAAFFTNSQDEFCNAYPSGPVTEVNSYAKRGYSLDEYPYNNKQCEFPSDPTLSSVNLDGKKQGWANPSGNDCSPGKHCLYLCQSGYGVSSRGLTSLEYHSNGFPFGKILCRDDGSIDKGSEEPLCIPDPGNVILLNLFDTPHSFCQRIYSPTNVILGSNSVDSLSHRVLNVPFQVNGRSSSFFYMNPPGTPLEAGCTGINSLTNRGPCSPYVLDVSKDYRGTTHVKVGWNPFYINDQYWGRTPPNWGLKLLCQGGDCDKPSCSIDPTKHNVNECENCDHLYLGASFCSISVSAGSRVVVVLFSGSNSDREQELLQKLPPLPTDNSDDSDDSSPGERLITKNKKSSYLEKNGLSYSEFEGDKHSDTIEDKDSDLTLKLKLYNEGSKDDIELGNEGLPIDGDDKEDNKQISSELDKKLLFKDPLSRMSFYDLTKTKSSADDITHKSSSKNNAMTLMFFEIHGKDKQMGSSDISCSLSGPDSLNPVGSVSSNTVDKISYNCEPTRMVLFIDKKITNGYKLIAEKFDSYATKISSLIQNNEFQTIEYNDYDESEGTCLLYKKNKDNVEAVNIISKTWNKQSLTIVYISIFIMTYCISLESQTTSNFIVPATSYFGKNSLIPLINTINGILYAVMKQQMGKVGIIFRRTEGFYMSNFLNRGLLNSILDVPFLINVWVGPSLAQSIYLPALDKEQWRLGYGIWAIVLSVGSLPIITVLYLDRFKTNEMDILSLKNNKDELINLSVKKFFVECDFVGIVLLFLGLILLLFQLIHEFPVFYNIKSLYIATIFIITVILCVIFPLWEFYYAEYPIFNAKSFNLRTIESGTYLYVTKSNSIKRVGYLNNVFSFTSTIVAIFVSILIKYNKRCNIFVYIGPFIYVFGIIYMIYNLRVDESIIEMTISQAMIGIGGGFYNMSALIGVQASSNRRQAVVNTALFLTLASIGGAVGSAISGIVWSNLLPKMLDFYSKRLNLFLTSNDYSMIIGSPLILDQYPKFIKGTIGRIVIILAYNDVMKLLYICSAMCVVPMLFCVIFIKDIHLNKAN